jgi:putative ABC transport system permease protein
MDFLWRSDMGKLSVYLLYPTRSLIGRKQRTIFSIFVIAISVTAIVSIGIMTDSSEKSLVGNVKSLIGGDISISYLGTEEGSYGLEIDDDIESFMNDLQTSGEIETWTFVNQTVRGTRSTNPEVTQEFVGLEGINEEYPLYGIIEVVEPKGMSLKSLIADPDDVAINDILAENLKLKVGDTLLIISEGGEMEFRVAGIVKESRGVGGLFGTAIMRYEIFQTILDIDKKYATEILIKTENDDLMHEVARKTKDYFDDRRIKVSIDEYKEATQSIVDQLGAVFTFFKLAGILSLLVGAVGIITTMLISMKERKIEIGIMKTVGIRSRDIILFFLIESLIVGVAGSIIGIGFGIFMSRLLVYFMEGMFRIGLQWIIAPSPLIFGLFIGIVSTAAFGLAPAYLASKTRPNVVLKEMEEKTTLWKDVGFLSVCAIVLASFGFIVYMTLKSMLYVEIIYGFMLGGLIQVVLLRYFLRLISHFPSFGLASIKMALRNIERQKWMMATTLLAIITGIGLVGSIFMTSQNVKATISEAMSNAFGYDVQVWYVPYSQMDHAVADIARLNGVTEVYPAMQMTANIIAINDKPMEVYLSDFSDNEKDALGKRLTAIIDGQDMERTTMTKTIKAGRTLDLTDVGKFNILLDNVFADDFKVGIGDNITFGLEDNTQEFKVIGIYDRGFMGGPPTSVVLYTSFQTLNNFASTSINADVKVKEINGKGITEMTATLNVVDLRKVPQKYEILYGRPLGSKDIYTTNCVINVGLAKILNVGVGDRLRLDSGGNNAEFTIIGVSPNIFNKKASVITSYDGIMEVVPAVHTINLSIKIESSKTRSVVSSLKALFPNSFVFDLSQVNVVISNLLDQSMIPVTFLASFSLMVGSLIIANSIYMAALDRRREIGVMKALGAKRLDILFNMTVENLIIGLIGGIIGVIITVFLSYILGTLFRTTIHLTFQPLTMVGLIFISLLIAAIASIIPAYNAAKVKPLVALKYE